MERMLYLGIIVIAFAMTFVLQQLWGEEVMAFLVGTVWPLIQNTIGSTGAIIGAMVVITYGLARNNGRLLKELLGKGIE